MHRHWDIFRPGRPLIFLRIGRFFWNLEIKRAVLRADPLITLITKLDKFLIINPHVFSSQTRIGARGLRNQ